MKTRGRILTSILLGGLSAAGCASNRTCCKQCIDYDGVPLENVAAFEGDVVQGGAVPGETAPAAPSWQPSTSDQAKQVPPIVHPMPPPRQSTSGKVDDQGKAPATPQPLPKETKPSPPPEVKKLPEQIQAPTPKNSEPIPPIRKPLDSPPVQQLPKAAPVQADTPRPPVRNADLRPASLRVKVSTSMVVTNIGDRVTFEIVVENQGGMAISNVDLQATLNDNLKPLDAEPMGSARIDRNTVTFTPIKNLGATPQRFKVRAEVVKQDGGVGLATIEALSPILTAGPLRDQASVRILPKD